MTYLPSKVPSGSPARVLVGEYTASDVSSIDITGLDFNTDLDYEFEVYVNIHSGTTAFYQLNVWVDDYDTDSNYRTNGNFNQTSNTAINLTSTRWNLFGGSRNAHTARATFNLCPGYYNGANRGVFGDFRASWIGVAFGAAYSSRGGLSNDYTGLTDIDSVKISIAGANVDFRVIVTKAA